MKKKNYASNYKYAKFGFLLFIFCFFNHTLLAQLACGQDIDLNDWNEEGMIGNGQWTVNAAGTSVTQGANGPATWFVSTDDYINVLIQGSIRVNIAADDDLIGFVFGYQDPIGALANPSNTYMKTFVFDWKQATQTYGILQPSNEGFALYEYDGFFDFTANYVSGGGPVYQEFWERLPTSEIDMLATDYGNNGWNDFTTYAFQLKYTTDSIVIWIDNDRVFEEAAGDECFEPGRFGFYNHSQSSVRYFDFSFENEYDFSVDSILCVGYPVLFETGLGCTDEVPPGIDFTWDFGDGTTGTGIDPSHVYSSAGTYIVQMIFTDSTTDCTDTTELEIVVNEDCCIAAIDPLYTTIAEDINFDTNWPEKVFIPDNTIVTVNNAVLDITNVDVVFGECSGIDFINGGTIRANNSVFRPCKLDDTWRGLRFEAQTIFTHQINENTFQNAEIALLFKKNANAEINSNTFANCNEGIKMDASVFTESIFGNNFVTNNAFPEHTGCYESTSPTDIIHIHNIGTAFGQVGSSMVINQNNFVMSNLNGSLQTTAIDMLHGRASISENTITNMNSSIVIDDPRGPTFVEGNEIENNFQFNNSTNSLFQIGVFNSDGVNVTVKSNELRNSKNTYNSTGIFLDRLSNISILNNFIEGFSRGISGRTVTLFNISENYMNSIETEGIFIGENSLSGRNYITCNDITMIMGEGVSISTNRCSRFTEISSNCVKDGREGIRVAGAGLIPLIRNNYIYNYEIGINNIGHTGNVGTATDPGMNTLWSNNNNSTDINSNTTIQAANNFGMFNISGVQITQNNPTHSTASCGHQIFNMPSQGNLNTDYNCDNGQSFIAPKVKKNGKILLPDVDETISYLSKVENKKEIVSRLIQLEDCDNLYLKQTLDAFELEQDDLNEIWYTFYKHNNNFEKANELLNNMNASEKSDFIQIEKINLKRLEGKNLDENDFISLESILADTEIEDALYNLAVSISKTGSFHGSYRSSFESIVFNDQITPTSQITQNQTSLKISPNPSINEINIEILEGNLIEGQELIVYDMHGNIVQTNQLGFISGKEKINISALKSGTYFIVLVSDGSLSERARFIKL